MATVNPTPSPSRKASKRPATARVQPSVPEPPALCVTTRTRATRKPVRLPGGLPAYGVDDGVLSFRHGLRVSERATIDEAIAIVGRTLRGPRDVFGSPGAVKAYLTLHMAGLQYEKFAVLFLDVQNRAIAFESMFSGTLTQTSVYPRQIAMAALAHHAAAVVLAHNHPSGSVQPSRADELLTLTLKAALALVDVRVLDHVIVGAGEALSMAEHGML